MPREVPALVLWGLRGLKLLIHMVWLEEMVILNPRCLYNVPALVLWGLED
jgi:hypothetical protein